MNKDLLSTLAKWAAILSFALYAIDFLNLNPFKSNDGQFEQSVIEEIEEPVNDDQFEHPVIEETEEPVNEPTISNNNNYEDIIDYRKAINMSLGELLLIPFKDHMPDDYLLVALIRYFNVSYLWYKILEIVFFLPVLYFCNCFIKLIIISIQLFRIRKIIRRGFIYNFKQTLRFSIPTIIGTFYLWYLLTLIGSINWL